MFDELKSRMNKFWNDDRTLAQTDPEFVELFSNFAYDEVVNEPGANHPDLDDSTRSMAILAALIGCQGLDDFELMVPVAFDPASVPSRSRKSSTRRSHISVSDVYCRS